MGLRVCRGRRRRWGDAGAGRPLRKLPAVEDAFVAGRKRSESLASLLPEVAAMAAAVGAGAAAAPGAGPTCRPRR